MFERAATLRILATLAVACLPFHTAMTQEPEQKPMSFYIGTYTNGISQGIYLSGLDAETGELAQPRLVAELENPSFLAVHPTKPVLYAVSEVGSGQVVAYRIEEDGGLSMQSHVDSAGSAPCYISTNADGSLVFVANYGSGSLASYRASNNGEQLDKSSAVQHQGSSVHRRQEGPHAHCILQAPDVPLIAAVDLGLDQVIVYRTNDNGELQVVKANSFQPGSGPRHMAFHPGGKHAFVIHELSCEISVCDWDGSQGSLVETQTLSTLPREKQSGESTAEILVHPNGRFVYGSNRGHNTIACFQFADGKLTSTGHTPTQGETPRNFRIDPTGRFLLAENQGSDSIHVFSIDPQSGELTATGHSIRVGAPVCIRFTK